jgi:hypothetical protein
VRGTATKVFVEWKRFYRPLDRRSGVAGCFSSWIGLFYNESLLCLAARRCAYAYWMSRRYGSALGVLK